VPEAYRITEDLTDLHRGPGTGGDVAPVSDRWGKGWAMRIET
jgi:hypothetical protein